MIKLRNGDEITPLISRILGQLQEFFRTDLQEFSYLQRGSEEQKRAQRMIQN